MRVYAHPHLKYGFFGGALFSVVSVQIGLLFPMPAPQPHEFAFSDRVLRALVFVWVLVRAKI